MIIRVTGLFLLGALAAGALPDTQADTFEVPALTGPVVDSAGMIDRAVEQQIDQALRHLRSQGGAQINVLTVPDLGGLPIEQASIRVTDEWKLGGRKEDNGVLLMIAQQERKLRIEVGQGLEGRLTDVESKRIIEESIVPMFRAGHVSGGVLIGVYKIALKTDPNVDLKRFFEGTAAYTQRARPSQGKLSPFLIFLIILFILFGRLGSFMPFGRPRYHRRGGWGGGIGGGGFGGGGGWGGGGGGFSGGGASGSW